MENPALQLVKRQQRQPEEDKEMETLTEKFEDFKIVDKDGGLC